MSDTTSAIDPRHAILLVMDYQQGIVASMPGADELLGRVAEAIAAARGAGMRVGYVRVAFEDANYEAVPAANKGFAAALAGRRMDADSPDTAIADAIAPNAGDIIVRKTRVGAFSTTDLDQQLRAERIDTLVLAGIATGGVVLSTVRDAADRDFSLYVLADACADRDPEVHDLLMGKLFPRQATVIAVSELPGVVDAP